MIYNNSYSLGETTLLVPEVYLMCTIGPLSFNQVLLIPQVSKLSTINHLLTTINIIIYVTNEIVMWHFLNWRGIYFYFKKIRHNKPIKENI